MTDGINDYYGSDAGNVIFTFSNGSGAQLLFRTDDWGEVEITGVRIGNQVLDPDCFGDATQEEMAVKCRDNHPDDCCCVQCVVNRKVAEGDRLYHAGVDEETSA